MKYTLKDLLLDRAQQYENETFLFWEDQEVTYGQLLDRARRIASGLARRGLHKDDKVAVWAMSRPEYVDLIFGSALAGTVLVPINTQFKADEAQHILVNSEAKLLVTQPQFDAAVAEIQPRCPQLKHVVMLDEEVPRASYFNELYETAANGLPDLDESDLAALIYTSGTTGHPKGVMLSHKNLAANAASIAQALEMTTADRFMCILPLYHVYGLIATVLAPLAAGGSMVLLPRFSPKDFLPRLERYRVTAFSGAPTVFAILNTLPDAENYDLSALRFCLSGAAPLAADVLDVFERRYKAFILEGYGLTEATCACTVNPLGKRRRIGSVGLPLPGQEVRIVNDQDQPMQWGQVGEITVRGDNVMTGYHRELEATSETVHHGWLHTGDLGYQDREGYFYLVGRKKDVIIHGCENIYPAEVEEVISTHPKIMDAAVVGMPDKIWGEEVTAFITLKDGEDMKAAELIDFCRRHLADFKCPRLVFFRDRLPRSPGGKILKSQLAAKLPSKF